MKLLSRDFTPTEKALLLFLSLVLLGLVYYRFVDQVVREEMIAAEAERDEIQIELTQVQAQVGRFNRMRDELDELYAGSRPSVMGSYNNAKSEISFLNDVLAAASQYSISFSAVTRDGDQIRRNFTLQFTSSDFASASQILTRLTRSEWRCLLGDMSYSASGGQNGSVSVTVTGTFYETMVGGTPDDGLPADTAATETTSGG